MTNRSAFEEAVLLASARLQIQDPELKQGQVEMATVQIPNGTLSLPWGKQGGFAVVYKFRRKSGKLVALRCFQVQVPSDIKYRYERIGAYFAAHLPDNTVSFKYHDQGILIKEPGQEHGGKVYPVIEMDWVEGVSLFERADELSKKRDQLELYHLVNQWTELFIAMRRNHIAHGDLSGNDVLVRVDSRLILVDYDAVYIPEFAGLAPIVLGQVNYQHPQMKQRNFNEYMDDFSALVIYTALLALSIQPELRDKFMNTNLMFAQGDFLNPSQSALMRELQSISDPRLQVAVQELKKACQQPIDLVRFPFHIIGSLK